MSETLNHGPNGESFETEDLSPQGVFYFMGGLAVLGVVIALIVGGMYRYLDALDRKTQPAMNPMAVKTDVDPQTMTFRDITSKVGNTFPKPVLEYSEKTQFTEEVDKQDKMLASYDWVDEKNGVARIPIERAMDLLVERGLPVVSQDDTATTKPESKGKPVKKAAAPTK